MVEIRGTVAHGAATRTNTSGAFSSAAVTPDGALHGLDWLSARIFEGLGYHVTIGTFSAPLTGGGAGTVFDQNKPEGIISIPTGTTLVPVRFAIQCQVPLLATDADESEILIAVDGGSAHVLDGTVVTEVVFNMRTNVADDGGNVIVASAASADVTNPTLDFDIARAVVTGDVQGTPANAVWTHLDLLYEPVRPPLIVGPASVLIYWGGTVATPGFAQLQWVEVPTAMFG